MISTKNIGFGISPVVVVFFVLGLLSLVLLLIVAAVGRKDGKVSPIKKLFIAFLTLQTGFFIITTPMVYTNIIPLSLHLGYYIEVNDYDGDGKINGYKITMESISYYEVMDINKIDKQKDKKGKYTLSSNYVTFIFENDSNEYTYEITDFGRSLSIDGKVVYVYFHDIEMR